MTQSHCVDTITINIFRLSFFCALCSGQNHPVDELLHLPLHLASFFPCHSALDVKVIFHSCIMFSHSNLISLLILSLKKKENSATLNISRVSLNKPGFQSNGTKPEVAWSLPRTETGQDFCREDRAAKKGRRWFTWLQLEERLAGCL